MNRDKILEIAKAQVGYKESPPNSNLTKYNQWYYGKNTSAPWCATSVSWIFNEAASPLPQIQNDSIHKTGAAYVPYIYDFYKKANKLTSVPFKGDIVIFDWNFDKSGDHIGIFVDWVVPGKSFHSYEGNTSPSSDSNGGEYQLRIRYKSQVLAFINPEEKTGL